MGKAKAPAVPATNIRMLYVEQIELGGGTQVRALLDNDVLEDYAQRLEDGTDLGPPVVFFDGQKYWLADGFHRVAAHVRILRKKIRCEVRDGDVRAATLYSLSANAKHGLRLTNEDKRRAVLRLLNDEEWTKWSDRVIAKTCAVSRRFVDNLRSKQPGGHGAHLTRRKGSDFKTYDVSGSTKTKGSKAEKEPKTATSKDAGVEDEAHLTKATHPEAPTESNGSNTSVVTIEGEPSVLDDERDGTEPGDASYGSTSEQVASTEHEMPSEVATAEDVEPASDVSTEPIRRTRPAGIGWGETVGEANGLPPPRGPVAPMKKLCKHCRGAGWIEFDLAKGVANAD